MMSIIHCIYYNSPQNYNLDKIRHELATAHSACRDRKQLLRTAGSAVLSDNLNMLLAGSLVVTDLDLLCGLLQADVSHSIFAVEDPGTLLESEALGFREDEVHPDKLEEIPNLDSVSNE
jgi:hypothetical protein